jgi:hypothetical protein
MPEWLNIMDSADGWKVNFNWGDANAWKSDWMRTTIHGSIAPLRLLHRARQPQRLVTGHAWHAKSRSIDAERRWLGTGQTSARPEHRRPELLLSRRETTG